MLTFLNSMKNWVPPMPEDILPTFESQLVAGATVKVNPSTDCPIYVRVYVCVFVYISASICKHF